MLAGEELRLKQQQYLQEEPLITIHENAEVNETARANKRPPTLETPKQFSFPVSSGNRSSNRRPARVKNP
jgi:hypothetical protein